MELFFLLLRIFLAARDLEVNITLGLIQNVTFLIFLENHDF